MREYEPRYPLEPLDSVMYPNLLRDCNNKIISENIMYLDSPKKLDTTKVIEEIELKVKKDCRHAEVAYHDCSGNRWIFLILDKNQNQPILRRMQTTYKKLYKKMNKSNQ